MNMEEMLQKAQEAAETIQKQMGEAQAKLDTIEVEGVAGGGLVKIRCTAKAWACRRGSILRGCERVEDRVVQLRGPLRRRHRQMVVVEV